MSLQDSPGVQPDAARVVQRTVHNETQKASLATQGVAHDGDQGSFVYEIPGISTGGTQGVSPPRRSSGRDWPGRVRERIVLRDRPRSRSIASIGFPRVVAAQDSVAEDNSLPSITLVREEDGESSQSSVGDQTNVLANLHSNLRDELSEGMAGALEGRFDVLEPKSKNMAVVLQDPILETPLTIKPKHEERGKFRTMRDLVIWISYIEEAANEAIETLGYYEKEVFPEIEDEAESLSKTVSEQQEQIKSLSTTVLELQLFVRTLIDGSATRKESAVEIDTVDPKVESTEMTGGVGQPMDVDKVEKRVDCAEDVERQFNRIPMLDVELAVAKNPDAIPPVNKSATLPTIRAFKKEDSPTIWLNENVVAMMQEGVDLSRWVNVLSAGFEGMTKSWYRTLLTKCNYVVSWNVFKQEFLEKYKDRDPQDKTIQRIRNVKFTDMSKYVTEFQQIIREAPPGMIPDDQWRLHFLETVPPATYFDFKLEQKKRLAKDIETLLQEALDWEQFQKEKEAAIKVAGKTYTSAAGNKSDKPKKESDKTDFEPDPPPSPTKEAATPGSKRKRSKRKPGGSF